MADVSGRRRWRTVGTAGAIGCTSDCSAVIAAEVDATRAQTIEATTLAETVAAVEQFFATGAGERAARSAGLAQRQELLREANLDIVEQVRGYYARPWAEGDPEAVVRAFMCECAEPL